MAKLWGGRFSKDTNALVDAFNASIEYDQRLYKEDILGKHCPCTYAGQYRNHQPGRRGPD